MEISETVSPRTRRAWRAWLERHHSEKQEIWVVVYKKGSGKPTATQDEAVEEAICFGWIDGQIRSMDEERYAVRFTPRRKRSHWSRRNRARAREMLRQGKMAPAGIEALPAEMREGLDPED